MFEIGVFHNGASDLKPVRTESGVVIYDGSLAAVHTAAQRTIVNQVRQGMLAEKLGFDYWFQTKHHFQPEGAELSPNPLASQLAIATNTRRIRLGQAANIITWHHPVRLAELAAMLDVVSGGGVEIGIGRGYQPCESEVLGKPFGSTIQDQERNRVAFSEALEIMIKCWTEPSVSPPGRKLLHFAGVYPLESQADYRLLQPEQRRSARSGTSSTSARRICIRPEIRCWPQPRR